MTRQRAAAIILKDGKILLVRDARADFFSMPGGSLEEGEDQLAALQRELHEELGVALVSAAPYLSFDLVNQVYKVPQTDHAYLAVIEGVPACSAEICELKWVSKSDIINCSTKVPTAFLEHIFPKLIADNLIA